jgi:hypothetical protein
LFSDQSGKPEAVASSDDDFDYGGMIDAKERSQDRRKTVDALKFDKKSSALSELKARKQERERSVPYCCDVMCFPIKWFPNISINPLRTRV